MSEESLEDYTDRVIPSWFRDPDPDIDLGLVERPGYYAGRGLHQPK